MDLNAIARVVEPWQPPFEFNYRQTAAVAMLITPALELLFVRRAEVIGDPWSGHIAFPGGRFQPDDLDPLVTAKRETLEEIGIDLSNVNFLGALAPVVPVTPHLLLTIYPFVFALDSEPRPVFNREVTALHRLSLSDLLTSNGRCAMDFSWQDANIVLPCVQFDQVQLWGLTLRIVDDLLNRLDGRGDGLQRLENSLE